MVLRLRRRSGSSESSELPEMSKPPRELLENRWRSLNKYAVFAGLTPLLLQAFCRLGHILNPCFTISATPSTTNTDPRDHLVSGGRLSSNTTPIWQFRS